MPLHVCFAGIYPGKTLCPSYGGEVERKEARTRRSITALYAGRGVWETCSASLLGTDDPQRCR